MFNIQEITNQKDAVVESYAKVADLTVDFGKAMQEATDRLNQAKAKGDGVEFGLSVGMVLGGLKIRAQQYGAALDVHREKISGNTKQMIDSLVAYYLIGLACGTPDREVIGNAKRFREASAGQVADVDSIYGLLSTLPNKDQIAEPLSQIKGFCDGVKDVIAYLDKQLARTATVSFETV